MSSEKRGDGEDRARDSAARLEAATTAEAINRLHTRPRVRQRPSPDGTPLGLTLLLQLGHVLLQLEDPLLATLQLRLEQHQAVPLRVVVGSGRLQLLHGVAQGLTVYMLTRQARHTQRQSTDVRPSEPLSA